VRDGRESVPIYSPLVRVDLPDPPPSFRLIKPVVAGQLTMPHVSETLESKNGEFQPPTV